MWTEMNTNKLYYSFFLPGHWLLQSVYSDKGKTRKVSESFKHLQVIRNHNPPRRMCISSLDHFSSGPSPKRNFSHMLMMFS